MTAMSNLPPWAVTSMPMVWLNDCDPEGAARSFRPVSFTAHRASPGSDMVRYGQVLWASRLQRSEVAVAWDWVELPRKIIAMADPMQVVSNIQLQHDDGRWMNERQRILWLNDLVHALPWQAELVVPAVDHFLDVKPRLAA